MRLRNCSARSAAAALVFLHLLHGLLVDGGGDAEAGKGRGRRHVPAVGLGVFALFALLRHVHGNGRAVLQQLADELEAFEPQQVAKRRLNLMYGLGHV